MATEPPILDTVGSHSDPGFLGRRRLPSRPVAETSFTISYDGPDLQAGRMEVRDLAPALIALADLIKEANAVIDPGAPSVNLEIKATSEGSFAVDLLIVQEAIDQIVGFFSSDAATTVVNLKEFILLGSAGSYGLFRLIKRIGNKPIQSEEPVPDAPGLVRITLADGTVIETNERTWALYRSVRIRRLAREVVAPVSRSGIDLVRFTEDTTDLTVDITNEDFEAFAVPDEPTEELGSWETTMGLQLASVAFADGNKWRLSDGDRTFFASILDESFLARVDDGEPFRKGDILTCRLQVSQARTESGLTTTYEVTEVLEHIARNRPIQLTLAEAADQDEAG